MMENRKWKTEAGLEAEAIFRERTGVYCGYVIIPETHPLYGKDGFLDDFMVHGGVTFTGRFIDETDWRIGFDCGHAGDKSYFSNPIMAELFLNDGSEVFRDLDYVVKEYESLARQLVEGDEMSKGVRIRVKSVEELEKTLGVKKGEDSHSSPLFFESMWEHAGREFPDIFDGYKDYYKTSSDECWAWHSDFVDVISEPEAKEEVQPKPTPITDKEHEDSSLNNGGKTDYYQLPNNIKDADDFIEHRGMNFNQGNMVKAIWCLNTKRHAGTTYERDLNKIIHYANRELRRIRK